MVLVSLKTKSHCKNLIHSGKSYNSPNSFTCNSIIQSYPMGLSWDFNFETVFLPNQPAQLQKKQLSRSLCTSVHLLSPPHQPSWALPGPRQDPRRCSVHLSMFWNSETPPWSHCLTQNFLSSQTPTSKHKTDTPLLKSVRLWVFRAICFRSKKVLSLTAELFTQMPVAWTLIFSGPWGQYQHAP